MSFIEEVAKIFISESEIPARFLLDEEVHQREYLCNGEMI